MLQDIRLYIDKKLVDFSNEISLPFTYQLEDLSNPTVIKNSFTKTITIQGTKNNNAIFGEIYNFDREQLYSENLLTGAYFNPSKRTPFELYRNGEIIESGYMQLNDISIKKKEINYNITLYGGLGDFFYSLSYTEENEPLQLKDLIYEEELTFNIDKNIIRKCWENIGKETGDLTDVITFIPSYNGVYEDFDNDKVLINTHNSPFFTNTSQIVDGKEYKTYNGYLLAELNKELTEWEMRSLMSYKQRPALRFRKFLNACCNPENNGGYEVELDNSFFNVSNPYYNQSYIALPLLSELIEKEAETIEHNITVDSSKVLGINGDSKIESITAPINDILNTTDYAKTTTIDIDLDIQLYFQSSNPNYKGNLYFSTFKGRKYDYYGSLLAQIEAVDADTNEIVGRSNIYNFTNQLLGGYYSNPSVWKNWNNPTNTPIQNVFGHFEYSKSINRYYFKGMNGTNTFRIKLEKCYKADRMKFNLVLKTVSNKKDNPMGLYHLAGYSSHKTIQTSTGLFSYLGDSTTSILKIKTEENAITSGIKINQDILLKTEKTPFDYLVGFCKLFNLYFYKVIGEKKIIITKRNNFFNDNIINIEDRIDWDKDAKISPISFNKKFYKLALEDSESYINKKYKNEYGVEYGQKRINTNYNFNAETHTMLENNVYQNVVSMIDNSPYYRTYYNKKGDELPPFMIEDVTLKYFADDLETTDVEQKQDVDVALTKDWNRRSGYDITDKLCCFEKDEVKTLSDIQSALVFYDGNYDLKYGTHNIVYNIVDDTPEMYRLNGKPCHLYSNYNLDRNRNWVSYRITKLPKFSRYIIKDNTITDSWDFGKPKELFIPNLQYDDRVTIYNQYWENIYNDKLDINTKVFSCNVSLRGLAVNTNLLKNFYYFNGCYWLLNKIENYDINSNETVKCEFIKINEISNYLKDNANVYDYFFAEDEYIKVPYNGGTIKLNIYSTTDWVLLDYDSNHIKDIYPMSGEAGTTQLTIQYKENNDICRENKIDIILRTENNVKKNLNIVIEQQPKLDNVVRLNGKVKNKNFDGEIYVRGVNDGIVYNFTPIDYWSGEYSLYVPKDVEIWVEVHSITDESVEYSKKYKFSEDSNLDIVM